MKAVGFGMFVLAVGVALTPNEAVAASPWAELGGAAESEEIEALRKELGSMGELLEEAKAEMEAMRSRGKAGTPGGSADGANEPAGRSGKAPSASAAGRSATPAPKARTVKKDAQKDTSEALLEGVETRLDEALERLGAIEAAVGGRKPLD